MSLVYSSTVLHEFSCIAPWVLAAWMQQLQQQRLLNENWLIYTSTTSSLCKSIICPWKNLAGVISVVQVFIIPVMAHEHIPCNARECQNRFMDLCVYQLQSLRQRLVKSQPRISLQCSSGLHTEKSVHIHFNSKSTLVLFCKDHTQTQGRMVDIWGEVSIYAYTLWDLPFEKNDPENKGEIFQCQGEQGEPKAPSHQLVMLAPFPNSPRVTRRSMWCTVDGVIVVMTESHGFLGSFWFGLGWVRWG